MSDLKRAKEIFLNALDVDDTSARLDFVREQCGDDEGLRAMVDRLLQADEQDNSLLDCTRSARRRMRSFEPMSGRVGGYEIVGEIGRGGMGVVYEAQQFEPKRHVALKVLAGTPGIDALRRFRREANILGRLNHPNIARVYEAGSHDDGLGGRPFFAMELIEDGLPIDQYVARHDLDRRQRLELFIRACDAVDYAHERGVIHRDLKPSNILVGGDGEPKVIDFGVARVAGDADMSMVSMATSPGQLIGTLRYISPEQFEARDQDEAIEPGVRSDVYSLGVVLYELLTGSCPYPIDTLSPYDLPRVIREKDPTRMSSIDSALRGDLETIVGKAMSKEPHRRYASVDALASDVRRYLAGEPIEARRDHALYVLRKSLVRYRLAIGIGAAVLVLSIAAALVYANLYRIAEHARAETQTAYDDLEVANYYNLIALAQNALESFNIRELNQVLEQCPEHLRQWEWHHLKARADDSVHTFQSGDQYFSSCVPLGDGRRIGVILGRWGVEVQIRQRFTDEIIQSFIRHHRPITHLAASNDGSMIAAGAHDQTAWVWDVESGSLLHTLDDLEFRCRTLQFSPDDRFLYISSGGRVSKYDLTLGQRIDDVTTHRDWATELALSANGAMLATCSKEDPRVRLWDAETLELISDLGRHNDQALAVEFTPDGRFLFSGSLDGTVKKWDVQSGECVFTERFGGPVMAVSVAPTGDMSTIVTGDAIHLRRLDGGPVLQPLRGHEYLFHEVFWLPESGRLLTRGRETIKEWDVHHRGGVRTIDQLDTVFESLVVADNGRWLICADERGFVYVRDQKTLELHASWRAHQHRVRTTALNPDGTVLAVGSDDKTVSLWSTKDWSLLDRLDTKQNWVRRLHWSPDGQTLIVGLDDSDVQLWNVADATLRAVVDLPNSRMKQSDLSSDGSTLLIGSESGKVHVIDLTRRRIVDTWPISDMPVSPLFVPGEDRVLVYLYDGTIEIRSRSTGQMLRSLEAHDRSIRSISFSPDGRRMVSSTYDGEPVVWDLETFRQLIRLGGAGTEVSFATFSSDGTTIFGRSGDDQLVAWEAPTYTARIQPQETTITSIPRAPVE